MSVTRDKAIGPDGYFVDFYKALSDEVVLTFTNLFIDIFKYGGWITSVDLVLYIIKILLKRKEYIRSRLILPYLLN